MRLGPLLALLCLGLPIAASAQLPDPLVFVDGQRIETQQDWKARRAEMLRILTDIQYGAAPPLPEVEARDITRETITLGDDVEAERVTVKLAFGGMEAQAGYWIPENADEPLPCLLADEPVWWDHFVQHGIVEKVVTRGYAFAGFWNDDFASYEDPEHAPAKDAFPGHDWGTAAIAAWGFRLTMNWIETVDAIDAKRVAIWGHSRRGKACAWAGATDERFAAVIPHMSGMGGSALYRVRSKGAQELEGLLERYWLKSPIYAYIDREEALPFDQHWLHALIAPRPMYAHVGIEDHWGNPRGEQAAWQAARKIYRWLDAEDNACIYFGDYGHHDPNGPEGGDSWDTALDFLDWKFRGKTPTREFLIPYFEE